MDVQKKQEAEEEKRKKKYKKDRRRLSREAKYINQAFEDEGWHNMKVVWVAGSNYVDWEMLYTPLKVGEHLGLRREPENPYDALAIMVVDDNEEKLGYIPRDENHELAKKLDDGEDVIAVVLEIDVESPYQKLCIGLFEMDESGEIVS